MLGLACNSLVTQKHPFGHAHEVQEPSSPQDDRAVFGCRLLQSNQQAQQVHASEKAVSLGLGCMQIHNKCFAPAAASNHIIVFGELPLYLELSPVQRH